MLTYTHREHEWELTGDIRFLADWGDAIMEIWAKQVQPPYEFEEKVFTPFEYYPGIYFSGDSYYTEEGKKLYELIVEKRRQFLSK